MTPTLCQTCGQNPATIHFTDIVNPEERRELHVCEACANAQGLTGGPPIPAMLASLVPGGLKKSSTVAAPKCPECGITLEEYKTKGRLGCPKDYTVFRDFLGPLLDRVHGARRHTGRMPRGAGVAEKASSDKLLRLRRQLQEAVDAERYEEAARLRDEIRTVEQAARETKGRGAGVASPPDVVSPPDPAGEAGRGAV